MRSIRYAAMLAGGYTLLAAVYIVVSSGIAARLSADVEEMKQIETLKGVLYVLVTALAVFFGARYAFARLDRAHAHISARDRALLDNERRIFAGLMAGSIAHDANNVLVAVIADLDALQHSTPAGDPTLDRLHRSVERLVALNRRLLSAARRGGVTQPEDVDLAQCVREALAVAGTHAQVKACDVRFDPPAPFNLHTHGLLVQQVLANLVVNAGEATGGRGRIDVRLHGARGAAVLEVHDDGPGVPADRRERIFEALETTKPGGSGLGLFSVMACVTAMRGAVEVDDSPLGGACFRVRLPDLPRTPAAPPAPAAAPGTPVRAG
jgi:signal transduction histidine kinase